MSFGCFLFGHDFGDAEVEREREEQGSEVITTIRERETCSRCGTHRVVSENTEVTTLETPAEDDDSTEQTDADPEPALGAEAVEDSAAHSEPAAREKARIPEEAAEPTTVDHATNPVTTDVDAETDDGVVLDDTAEEIATEEREPGQWPAEPDDDTTGWTPETNLESDARGPEVEATAEAVTVPSGEFHCPGCGFSTPVESSSLREGDYCPECHRGSLAHRPAE
jgi:hypothetical protein